MTPVQEPGTTASEGLTLEDIFAEESPLATPEAAFSLEEDPNLPDSQKKTTPDQHP
ncbi:MAG: hypothetical protein HC881_06735 [Leptolyngbyaceae cyanobacterium SL_7_1]|nr:hypothetical protein [Leptolyngbyaceae cyanobacterium SL_7_1]